MIVENNEEKKMEVVQFPRYKIVAEDPDTNMVSEFWPSQKEGTGPRVAFSPKNAEREARRLEANGYINVVFAQV